MRNSSKFSESFIREVTTIREEKNKTTTSSSATTPQTVPSSSTTQKSNIVATEPLVETPNSQLYEKALEAAKQRAIALAEQEFQYPVSLQNVSDIRMAIEKQNELLHTQLVTIMSAQIDEAQTALNLINDSDNIVSNVRD